MGEITDALRANLHELAQSDARLLRELDTLVKAGSAPAEGLPTASPAAQRDDGLERLSLKDLKELAKQRRIKGISKLKKDELIAQLRGGASASQATLSSSGRTTATPLPASAAVASGQLNAIESRLERMEGLLQRMAVHLGVS